MSKTYRISFEKGVNTIGDKSILPEGFVTFIDNASLRSGSPRPYKAPEWQFSALPTTTRSWSYRGRWFHSDNWQDHVGEYIGGIERVYTTEEGKYPTKTVGGTTALLGTARPKTPIGVGKSTDLTPGGLTASVDYSGNGNLPDGERLYRISAKTADGIMPPTAPISITVADTSHTGASVTLTWGQVPKATGYIVFEGTQTAQYRLIELSAAVLSYTDNGSITAGGDNAAQFEQDQPFTYAYSYLRNVNGVFDESGLSTPSQEITAAQGRILTRDFLNDGFFDVTDSGGNATAISGTGSVGTISATAYPPVSLASVVVTYNNVTNITTFAKSSHGFVTGDKGKFGGMVDPVWQAQTYDIIYVDANHFAIKGVNIPSDGTPLPATANVQPVKSLVTYSASGTVNDGDMVYLVGTGGTSPNTQSVNGFYKATYVSATTFTIPLISLYTLTFSTVKWCPFNNYYWRWRLYRSQAGIWQMVDEVTLDNITYADAKPASALGDPPTSYYTDGGQTVDYEKAPLSLTGIESHYGMMFGIQGHSVRWTPTLQPDAWPETFSVTLAYQPVALASFAQGLIILCEDAVYRLDGNTPTGMSLAKTYAEDGCFAPHSVQKTDKGLIYLAKRGIMLFDGSKAECLTDTRIPGTTLTAPSRLTTAYPFWWMPTIMSRNYADLAGEESIKGDQYSFTLDNTRTIEGYNKYIKSFYHLGAYYLFYSGADYAANTAFVVDLQVPGLPISTLGMKALDAHVDEFENAYVLFDNASPTTTVTITSPL